MTKLMFVIAFSLVIHSPCLADLVTINAGSSPDALFDVDTASGTVSNSRNISAVDVTGLAYDTNTNTIFGVTQFDLLVSIDEATGDTIGIGALGENSGGYGLAFDSIGNVLYASDPVGDALWTVDTSTGARTVVSSTSESFVGLAFDSNNSILYGVTPETDALYTINTTTGASSIIGSGLGITGGISINTGLAYDIGLGQLFLTRSAFDANDGLYLVDPLTGSASSQGGFGQTGNFSGLASTAATAVPEPSSAILISLLSLGLVVHRRQRRSDREHPKLQPESES